jgi:hypothetical protein
MGGPMAHPMHEVGSTTIHAVIDGEAKTLCGLESEGMRYFPLPRTTCLKCYSRILEIVDQ